MKFNINGRVCLLGFIAFGVLSVLLTKYIDPFVESLIISTPDTLIHTGCIVSVVIITIDIINTIKNLKDFNDKLSKLTEVILEKGSVLSETIAEKKNAVTDAISEKKSVVTDKLQNTAAYEKFDALKKYIYENFTDQQMRIVKAFPKMRSIKYNKALSKIREIIISMKKH